MNIYSGFEKLILSLLLLMGLTGCAALTVDVDVYKGPLANHVDVQTEQLTVMAIGAKPILIQLRNGLEEARIDKIQSKKTKSGEIQSLISTNNCYEDLDTLDFHSCEGYLHGHIKNYNFKDDNAGRVNAILGLYEDRQYSNLPPKIEINVRKIKGELKNFYQARDIFFNKNYEKSKEIWRKFEIAFRTSASDNKGVDELINLEKITTDDQKTEKRNDLIVEIKKLEAKYKKFFRPPPNKPGRNIQKLFDAHDDLFIIFENNSEFFTKPGLYKKDFGYSPPTEKKDTVKTMFNQLTIEENLIWDAQVLFPNNKAKIQQDFLDQITRVAGSYKTTFDTVAKLAELFKNLAEQLKITPHPDLYAYEAEAQYLADLLKESSTKPLSKNLASELDARSKQANIFASKLSSPLSRGRSEDGLESQIETYLNNLFDNKGSHKEIKQNLKDLHYALVHFAEKILFLANYGVLLNQYPENYKLSFTGLDGSPQNDLDSYVMVLQAVGNSILFQIDELRQQSDYEEKLDGNGPRELRALAQALPQYSENVFEKLITALRDDVSISNEEIIDVLGLGKLQNSIKNAKEKTEVWQRFTDIINLIEPPGGGGMESFVQNIFDNPALDGTPSIETLKSHFAGSLKNLIDTQKSLASSSSPDLLRKMTALHDFFNTILPSSAIHPQSGNKTALMDSIKQYLTTESSSALKKNNEAKQVLINLAKAPAGTTDPLTFAQSKLKEDIQGETTKRKNAFEVVKDNKFKIIRIFKEMEFENESDQVKVIVINFLTKQKMGNNDEKINHAIERVEARLKQMKFPYQISPQKRPDAKEVMDQLIASLRHEQIQVIREGGPGSGSAKKLEAALKLAYEQRSGLNYIRPAFSYLRNSFPSTSLQADASIGWKNMLLENTVQSLPFSGSLPTISNKKKKNRLKINQEIDKQYWQNINRVKLTGAGNTNYVVAKDDLGNWYVKNYSANPEDIIKSAKNLAMFGMGPGLGTNLLSDIPNTGGSVPGTPNLEDPADGVATAQQAQGKQAMVPRTPLERQYVKSKKKYDDKSKDALKDIKLKMTSLKSEIELNWAKNTTLDSDAMGKIKTALNTSSDTHLKEVEKKAGEDEIPAGEEIIETLRAIKYFKRDLESRINQLSDTEATKNANLKTAKEFAIPDFKATISGQLEKFIDKRQKTVENYEMAVMFIGESVSP